MDGIIVIDKEKNYTSRDIVNIIGKKFKTKKVGHTGTLDPLATGVLIVCIGKATKLVELLTNHDKEYIADITFGIETDTLDSTGNIITEHNSIHGKEEIEKVLKSFEKEYEQVVPKYSAIKINGKKLYEFARNGEEVILPKRNVKISSIQLLNHEIDKNKTKIKIKCNVSKGTYIRSLIRDIAYSLNDVAIMTDLRRTKVGNISINDAIEIEKINVCNIINIEDVLKDYKKVFVSSDMEFKIKNGVKVENIYNEEYILFECKDGLIGLYKDDNNILKPYKMF